MILDGWGKSQTPKVPAIETMQHPFYRFTLYQIRQFPIFWQMEWSRPTRKDKWANSEVGHMNLGAGVSFTKIWPN